MPKVTVSAESAVGPERVWELATDLPRVAEWNTMHEGFTGEVPATLTEGAAYRQRVKLMGMPAEMAWRVATADAPGRLELAGDGPMGVKAANRFFVESSGDGSKITYEMEFNGPALAGPMAGMLEKQAGTAAAQSLAKFTALL
ncbi:type II toxin-antitoxin system Rv0910 family toxin [Micromonospora sp. CPCC 206061]|uniref:type II toxin-antitoxin system Rv0910 family toxin n=1 Tax=Micromonospora sp. CPCC 206061 TaxID=3122410 RepID=UPI002FEEF41D